MRILVLVFVFVALRTHGQEIDKNYLRTIVKALSSDSMEGRYPGTPGIERAANYIEQSFREAGIADVRREEFNLLEKGYAEVYLRSGKKKFYCPDDIMVEGSLHVDSETEKELVFAGRGTMDELRSIDVKDRVVLVFLSNLRSGFDIARELYRRQAFALIAANPDNAAQAESMRRTLKDHVMSKRLFLEKSPRGQTIAALDTIRGVGTFLISNDMIPVLMNTSTRNLLRSIEGKTIKDVPISKIALKAEYKTRTIRASNIVAHVPGLTDTTIVVSAHYDHMGSSGSEIFHGADDNASGTASIIALAKKYSAMKSLRYSMTFLAVTAEEVGKLGSIYHTTTNDFDPKKVIFNLNIDMVGSTDSKHRSRDPYFYVIGHSDPVPKQDLLEAAAKINHINLDYSESGTIGFFQRSDQYSFHQRGIPAIHLFSGTHDRYHKATDTYQTLNYELLANRVEFASTFIELMQR
jgi:hypothetical protein